MKGITDVNTADIVKREEVSESGTTSLAKKQYFQVNTGSAMDMESPVATRYEKIWFKHISHFCAIPYKVVNILYNVRMYLLIVWNTYFIADMTTIAGNTRTAAERELAAPSDNAGDLECADIETANEDFWMYGAPSVAVIFIFMGILVSNLGISLHYEQYGSLGYISRYAQTRRMPLHKLCCRSTLFVVGLLVIFGFLQAMEQEAPISRVISPLLLGFYSTAIISWELYDDVPYAVVCTTKETQKIQLNYNLFTDVGSTLDMLLLGMSEAFIDKKYDVLLRLGMTVEECELCATGGLEVQILEGKEPINSRFSPFARKLMWFCGY
jgi:hypothetical protein